MYTIRMSFDFVYVNARWSSQHNSKVGRKSFNNFRLPQANCDKYFLKLHFLNQSIYCSSIFWSFSSNAQCNKEKWAILFKVISNINLQGGETNAHLSRYCTVQKVTYKNKIAIHAKSFMLNFYTGA